jgi:hypothetical protein
MRECLIELISPMLKPRLFGVLVSLMLLCSCATEKPTRSQLPADATLNKNAGRGGWIIVTLRLESGEELPFLLDTGAPWTLFDKSHEPKLGKRVATGTNWNFGTALEAGIYAAPKLYLGNTVLMMTGSNIGTEDCKKISATAGRPIMGILGMDVLEHYCIQLDFAARRMRFLDDEQASKKGWGKPFALTNLGNGCFSISENLTGAKGPASMIDTGALYGGWLMPDLYQQWTNQAKLPADGEVRSPYGVLAGERYPDIYLDRLDEKSLLKDETNISWNGIGLRFLSRHLVTLDFPKRTLYLKRTSIGPLVDKDTIAAGKAAGKKALRFLESLKKQGQLPGWSKKEKYAHRRETFSFTYPDTVAFNHLQKKGDSSIYHYEVTRASTTSPWKLQKAWRADQNDHTVEDYHVPP